MKEDIVLKHVENWRKETGRHSTDLKDFLSWFDRARDPEESVKSGWWDFSFHILKPKVISLLGEPFNKVALEIGYGAGRLLEPACHFFYHCYGVDIHQFKEKVEELIRNHGVTNFTLF